MNRSTQLNAMNYNGVSTLFLRQHTALQVLITVLCIRIDKNTSDIKKNESFWYPNCRCRTTHFYTTVWPTQSDHFCNFSVPILIYSCIYNHYFVFTDIQVKFRNGL